MPFTGSHLAAVLPLMRSRWLVPSALVIGSMVPDLPYYLPLPVTATLTHSPLGVLGVNVMLGLVALALWHGLLARFLAAISPVRLRERLSRPRVSVIGRLAAPRCWSSLWRSARQPTCCGTRSRMTGCGGPGTSAGWPRRTSARPAIAGRSA